MSRLHMWNPKPVNKTAARVLDALTAGLDKAGDHRRIDNAKGAYMAVHVERISDAPPLFSVAHYGQQNGDLMRDPEMVFWRAPMGAYYPTYFRNDYVGIERTSLEFEGEWPARIFPREQHDEASFAGTWMRNIREQQQLSLVNHEGARR